MKRLIGILCLLIAILPAYATVYQWTDKQGEVHFSDQPHKGAKTIKLPEVQTFKPPKLPQAKVVVKPAPLKGPRYKIIAIIKPLQEATIRNNQGFLAVTVELEPLLRKEDSLQLFVDDQAMGKPQQSTVFTVYDIYRGAHTVHVDVFDNKGKKVGRSETVTFYMHRPRVGMGSRVDAAPVEETVGTIRQSVLLPENIVAPPP